MAEYEDEEVVDEEAPLSAEELFELHKEEINAAFEEKGFFRRFSDMLKGLSKPKSSPEYKLARVELNRLAAPILAVVLPTIAVIVLIVVTKVTSQPQETIEVEIAETKEEEPLEEEQPEEEPEPPPEPPDEYVDVQVDTPSVTVSEMNAPTPTSEPLSVKPAPQDSVAIIKSPVTMRSMTGSRSPGSIGAMTRGGAGYGDAATEAAVYKVLRWLKYKQNKETGAIGNLPTTSLAVLVYLAHGETPSNSKEFGETVRKAIQYLVDAQVDGKGGVPTFKGTDGHEYATLIATYALCEAYGMTKNPMVRDAAMKTLTRIVNNQSETGGWDYKINKGSTRDDMSFEGWALQALKAGKLAGLHPDGLDDCIKKAIRCLKTRNFRNGGFNYTAGGGPTGLTATGCLAMQLLGYGNEPEVKSSLDFMREWLPTFESKVSPRAGGPLPGAAPQYYAYYAAQCKYQAGMCENADPKNIKSWQDWNVEMKKLYCSTLITPDETIEGVDGKPKQMGYWEKGFNGTMMGTCLCALQLMVYYRYLPTSKIEKTDKQAGGGGKAKPSKKETVDVEVDI